MAECGGRAWAPLLISSPTGRGSHGTLARRPQRPIQTHGKLNELLTLSGKKNCIWPSVARMGKFYPSQKIQLFFNLSVDEEFVYIWQVCQFTIFFPTSKETLKLLISCSDFNFTFCHRFCTPAEQCPIIDDEWESAEGVPISAILLGGRRPAGVPLVVESRDWQHGVFMGATMRSEATAAAEHAVSIILYHNLCSPKA